MPRSALRLAALIIAKVSHYTAARSANDSKKEKVYGLMIPSGPPLPQVVSLVLLPSVSSLSVPGSAHIFGGCSGSSGFLGRLQV